MNRNSKSILSEITKFVPKRTSEQLIESRAEHLISSAINLFESIDASFNEEEAEALKKRFMASIRGADAGRFSRLMEKLKNE